MKLRFLKYIIFCCISTVVSMTTSGQFLEPYRMYHKDTKTYSKYGYADEKGKLVIDTIYDYAGTFANGTAVVSQNGKAGIINNKNKWLLPLQYKSLVKQQEEKELVFVQNDTAWALMTMEGKLLTGFNFRTVGTFSEGMAVVTIKDKYGYINTKGELVVPPKYDYGGSFSSKRALVHVKQQGSSGRLIGYINTLGEEVIKPVYLTGTSFVEGYAAVSAYGGKSLIDSNGVLVTKVQYEEIGLMQNGRVSFKKGKAYGFLNKKGQEVIGNGQTSGLTAVLPFSEGLAAVKQGNYWGFVDTAGNFIIQPKYYKVKSFEMGITAVSLKLIYDTTIKKYQEIWGFIDKTGKEISPFTYSYADDGKDGGFIVAVGMWYDEPMGGLGKGGKKGLFNVHGEIIPPEYDYITKFINGKPYALASGNGKSYRFDIKGKLISQTN